MDLKGSGYGTFQAKGPGQMTDRLLHTNYSEELWEVRWHGLAWPDDL